MSSRHHGSAHSGQYRKPMKSDHSKKQFSRTASHVHKKNLLSGGSVVNRGGIRL